MSGGASLGHHTGLAHHQGEAHTGVCMHAVGPHHGRRACSREPQLCEDGDRFVCRHSIVSGEHSEVQRRQYYRGGSQMAVRMWPPPRVELCEKCLSAILAHMFEHAQTLHAHAPVNL